MSGKDSQENQIKYSDRALQQLVEVQEKELEVRQSEVKQRSVEAEHEYELAKRSIEAQERDRNNQRSYFSRFQTKRYIFIGVLSLAILFFLGFALWLGESELAMRIIEIVALIVAGGFGGYAIGYNKGRQASETE